MSVDRRTFLKGAAALSAAALAPGAAGTAAGAAGSPAPSWHAVPCRLCGVGCGLRVAVQDGRAIAVQGDTASSVSRGLACVKGYHAVQALYGRDRIGRALIRRSGQLSQATLAEAYARIATRLRETIAKHGPDSVGVYGSGQWSVTDAYIAAKLCKGGIGTNNVDTSGRLYDAAARAGLRTSYGMDGLPGSHEDVEHADVFILWGHNMAETDPVLFSRILERRRTNPAVRIVDMATRTTRTSYAADRALLHAPHAEIAVANAICHELIARRAVNRDFVDRHVAFARGAGATHAAGDDIITGERVVSSDFGEFEDFVAAYAPERVADAAGISAADIRWLASLYADRSKRVLSLWGAELSRHACGTWVNNVLHNIHLLTGKVASPGSGVLPCTTEPSGGDEIHAAGATPDGLPRGTVAEAADRELAARVWGVPAGRIPTRAGSSAVGLFRGLEGGRIRFLWIQSSDPLLDLPSLDRYRRAAAAGGAFIVVTDAYPTATTAMADVVLPAALWFEREGVSGSGERRSQYWPRLVAPPADARSDGWHTIEVARLLGYGPLFPWPEGTHAGDAWGELVRFHQHPARRPAGYAELKRLGGAIWPRNDGRETRWRYNTAHDPAADAKHGGFHFYGHADGRARIWLRPHVPAAERPDAGFPFWLATGPVLEHSGTGTLTRRIPSLHRAAPRAWAELNPEDAARLGIRSGDAVRLVTRRTTLLVEARLDHRTQPPPGMVFVPAFDEATPVNRLTLDECCPLSGQPAHGTCAVRVERVS
jgi:nitrate reductase (cytochrome)